MTPMTTLSLSNVAIGYSTEDYEIRIVDVSDQYNDAKKSAYGIFNKTFNVRELLTESLPAALLAIMQQQALLGIAVERALKGDLAPESAPPSPGEDFGPPRIQ